MNLKNKIGIFLLGLGIASSSSAKYWAEDSFDKNLYDLRVIINREKNI